MSLAEFLKELDEATKRDEQLEQDLSLIHI